jgi:hypothetical protein
MSFDDDDSYFRDDGCFIDAPYVLTKEEYSAKVLFDERGLLQSIQNNFDYLSYEKNKDGTIAFNLGDLLTHVPIFERLKWKVFYQGIEDVQMDYACNKLLFFDFQNASELEIVRDYWQARVENLLETEDQPWFTKKEKEQASAELHHLNQFDQETNQWRDLASMNFKPQVLDKYKNNDLCDIGSDHISFLRHDKTPVSIAWFCIRNNDVLMMLAKEFYNVPPIERSHWISYQIQSEQTAD